VESGAEVYSWMAANSVYLKDSSVSGNVAYGSYEEGHGEARRKYYRDKFAGSYREIVLKRFSDGR